MPLSHTDWTAEMLNELPDDGNRYEVIDGELFVTPVPTLLHQRAVTELTRLLSPYAKAVGLDLFGSPIGVTFSERREVQPDLSVLPRMPDGRLARKFADVNMLLLAVEVLSPSSLRTDRHRKRALYQDEGVADYWIVDTATRVIEHWTPRVSEPEIHSQSIEWRPVAGHAPLVIDGVRYFAEVYGE